MLREHEWENPIHIQQKHKIISPGTQKQIGSNISKGEMENEEKDDSGVDARGFGVVTGAHSFGKPSDNAGWDNV